MKNRTVIIAGATGLVGREILDGLLADPTVAAVHSLGRRPPAVRHAKLTFHQTDFTALPALPPADEAYLALGSTKKDAGSQAAFRALDYDATLAVARAALAAGVRTVGLVSVIGADRHSKFFYSRMKGEVENALAQMAFEGLVIVRPSLLVGSRAPLGQATRPGEVLGHALNRYFGLLIPRNYKPISAATVALTLLSAVPAATGRAVLLSGAMR